MERILRKTLEGGRFDRVDAQRSRTMAAIKSKRNRTTELLLRMAFVRSRIKGWVTHPRTLKGTPDFYFPAQRMAVFVDGCFWHGCPKCGHTPRTRSEYWALKISRNPKRDNRVSNQLRSEGVTVLRVWEHALTTAAASKRVTQRIIGRLRKSNDRDEKQSSSSSHHLNKSSNRPTP
jgi:DNA mismatch endonuclease (patch repair protein)